MNTELTLGQIINMDFPDPEFVLDALQPGDVGLISGVDGSGKSWVSMMAGLTVATGVSVGNLFGPPDPGMAGKVIYFAGEDRLNDHGRRMKSIIRNIKQDGVFIEDPDDDRLKIVVMRGDRKPLIRRGVVGESRYVVTDEGQKFVGEVAGYKAAFVDPLRMFHDIEETDGPGMDFLIRWLVSVAMRNEMVIMIAHHTSKDAFLKERDDHHTGRGATDLPAGCRGVWSLRPLTPTEAEKHGVDSQDWCLLTNSKASHARGAGKKYLLREEDGVLRSADLPVKGSRDNLKGSQRKMPPERDYWVHDDEF